MNVIHKVVAIVIHDNAFLMVRKAGKDIWTNLGGRPEAGETEEQCLVREIREEVGCESRIVRKLGDFEDKAVFDDAVVRLSTYLVDLQGEPVIQDPELEECRFIGKGYQQTGVKFPPSIENKILPFCIKTGLLNW